MLDSFMAKLRGMHKSWTVWFNGVCLAVAANWDFISSQVPSIREFVTPTMYTWLAIGVFAMNIVLRVKTTKSLADK